MKLPNLLYLATFSLLSACSSSPSLYPQQGIAAPTQEVGYPQQGIAAPQQTNKPVVIDEEYLEEHPEFKNLVQ